MKELNCLGMRCPLPIIAIGRDIKLIDTGDAIRLLSDDPASEFDLQAWARMTGHRVEKIDQNEFLVTKSKVN